MVSGSQTSINLGSGRGISIINCDHGIWGFWFSHPKGEAECACALRVCNECPNPMKYKTYTMTEELNVTLKEEVNCTVCVERGKIINGAWVSG